MNIEFDNAAPPFIATHPGEMIKDELKERLENVLGIPADICMNMQTQHDLDTANIAERDNQRETVSVTIPIRDRNLLPELVRKFVECYCQWHCRRRR